jgi:CRP-like cAMP-binding protein
MALSMSEAVMHELLKRVPMFADVPATDLAELVKTARALPRRKGARIFEEGSDADCCLVLTSGRAKVVVSGARDAEITLGMVEPFSVVGEVAMLDGSVRSAGLVAVEDCQFIRIPAAAFQSLRRNAAFENRLLAHLTSTLRRATDQLRAIHTFGAEDRVTWCLGRLAAQRGRREGAAIVIRPRPAHQELADMTGCSRETVSRILAGLRRKKRVTWDRGSLRLDSDAFRQRLRGGLSAADVDELTRLL